MSDNRIITLVTLLIAIIGVLIYEFLWHNIGVIVITIEINILLGIYGCDLINLINRRKK